MKFILAAPILILCAFASFQDATGQIIDFETTPSGETPTDNAALDRMTPYVVDGVEVRFGFDTNGDGEANSNAAFERVGLDPIPGFQATFGTQAEDSPRNTSSRSLGTYFLRPSSGIGVFPGVFVVSYSTEVAALSGEIWDLDAPIPEYEQWRITAFDGGGNVLKMIETPVGLWLEDRNSRDSLALPFQIQAEGIRRLEIEFIGTSTTVGLAFDNFRATTVSPTPPQLDIETAILLKFESELGNTYTIEESLDMENWTDSVTDIDGTGTDLKFFFEITEPRTFYRLKPSGGS